jgi:hypothetical protein
MVGDMDDVTTVESRHPHASKAARKVNSVVACGNEGIRAWRPLQRMLGLLFKFRCM